jgi:hypothetical protein|tara:strand:- start:107 stop:307 length:201 start_codon:yes stop_codon:yes gene_type:complete
MELINQPFTGQLGARLITLLDSPDYHTLNIVVAFAKNSADITAIDSSWVTPVVDDSPKVIDGVVQY